jgi:hypothetical protein
MNIDELNLTDEQQQELLTGLLEKNQDPQIEKKILGDLIEKHRDEIAQIMEQRTVDRVFESFLNEKFGENE